MEAVGDGGEYFTPFGKPASDVTKWAVWLAFVDGANFGAEGARGGLGDVAGAKNPDGKE